MKKLSLIVPCYNEKTTLPKVINAITRLKSSSLDIEIIIVDDCSDDGSYDVACELEKNNSNIFVCRHQYNQGKGAALKTGFLRASGDFVGIQDADLEYDPIDYLKILHTIMHSS